MIDASPFIASLSKKTVYVIGLGKTGLASIKAIDKAGAKVFAWDDDPDKHDLSKKAGAKVVSPEEADYSKIGAVMLSPGIPLTHPEPHKAVQKANAAEIEVLGDIEVMHRCSLPNKIIGITGTNGKSTTTALIGHILNECSVKAIVGGNIGAPVLALKVPKSAVLVLEMSSYQIDLCRDFVPHVGLMLNLTPDHIDRHGSMDAYAAVKARIFGPATEAAIIGADDEYSLEIAKELDSPIRVSTTSEPSGGVFVRDGRLIDATFEEGEEDVGAFNTLPALAGTHNHQNACAAYAACRALDLKPEQIFEAMKSFPGLPHRQQVVRTINGVAYINDSKATNAEATSKALATFRNLYWIVGGQAKEGGLDGLEGYMERIRHAYLIGEAAEDFAKWLDQHGVVHHHSKTLERAVQDAHEQAQSERGRPGGTGVILLSPACASWDQFESFEQRGEVFAELVGDLNDE